MNQHLDKWRHQECIEVSITHTCKFILFNSMEQCFANLCSFATACFTADDHYLVGVDHVYQFLHKYILNMYCLKTVVFRKKRIFTFCILWDGNLCLASCIWLYDREVFFPENSLKSLLSKSTLPPNLWNHRYSSFINNIIYIYIWKKTTLMSTIWKKQNKII